MKNTRILIPGRVYTSCDSGCAHNSSVLISHLMIHGVVDARAADHGEDETCAGCFCWAAHVPSVLRPPLLPLPLPSTEEYTSPPTLCALPPAFFARLFFGPLFDPLPSPPTAFFDSAALTAMPEPSAHGGPAVAFAWSIALHTDAFADPAAFPRNPGRP